MKVHFTNHDKEDTYLGDIISSDGYNTQNINSRIGKENGKINEIMDMSDADGCWVWNYIAPICIH